MPKISEHQIREYAFSLWEKAGRPEGRHKEIWEQAKRELGVDDGGSETEPRPSNFRPE